MKYSRSKLDKSMKLWYHMYMSDAAAASRVLWCSNSVGSHILLIYLPFRESEKDSHILLDWWNWQTRTLQVRMLNRMWVRVPHRAPCSVSQGVTTPPSQGGNTGSIPVRSTMNRVIAQFGSALRSGRRGRRFKSCLPDHPSKHWNIAKPVRLGTLNPGCAGSNPAVPAMGN